MYILPPQVYGCQTCQNNAKMRNIIFTKSTLSRLCSNKTYINGTVIGDFTALSYKPIYSHAIKIDHKLKQAKFTGQ
jgi:hypothetical protein